MMQFDAFSLSRLLQLASPMLPPGAFTSSQGLEAAVQDGSIKDEASARTWILGGLRYNVASLEGPVLLRLHDAWSSGRGAQVLRWNDFFLASHETVEFRTETVQKGNFLVQLLNDLGTLPRAEIDILNTLIEPTFPAAFSFAAVHWNIAREPALGAYLWAWAENQVGAAIKTIAMGQMAGQKILSAVADAIPEAMADALGRSDEALSHLAPAAMARTAG
jgi:urease accessory protein